MSIETVRSSGIRAWSSFTSATRPSPSLARTPSRSTFTESQPWSATYDASRRATDSMWSGSESRRCRAARSKVSRRLL